MSLFYLTTAPHSGQNLPVTGLPQFWQNFVIVFMTLRLSVFLFYIRFYDHLNTPFRKIPIVNIIIEI